MLPEQKALIKIHILKFIRANTRVIKAILKERKNKMCEIMEIYLPFSSFLDPHTVIIAHILQALDDDVSSSKSPDAKQQRDEIMMSFVLL